MKILVATLALAAVAVVQIQSFARDDSSSTQAMKVTIPIQALNGSNQAGTATLTGTADNKTQVDIALKGEPAAASEPAHIHPGPCTKLNPKPAYPLTSVSGGTSTTVIDAPLKALMSGPLSINVHESTANLSKYVACGDLPVSTQPAAQPGSMTQPDATASSQPKH